MNRNTLLIFFLLVSLFMFLGANIHDVEQDNDSFFQNLSVNMQKIALNDSYKFDPIIYEHNTSISKLDGISFYNIANCILSSSLYIFIEVIIVSSRFGFIHYTLPYMFFAVVFGLMISSPVILILISFIYYCYITIKNLIKKKNDK